VHTSGQFAVNGIIEAATLGGQDFITAFVGIVQTPEPIVPVYIIVGTLAALKATEPATIPNTAVATNMIFAFFIFMMFFS
jgi:hypothetical protein